MGKVTLTELQGLPDPLTSDLYEFVLGSIPGSAASNATSQGGAPATGVTGAGSSALRIQCQQISVPSKTVEAIPVDLAANTLMFAGRMTFDHSMNITFVENRKMDIYNTLDAWAEHCRNKETQLGHYKANYSTTAELFVYDQIGEVIKKFKIFGLWINVIPEYQFDSSASNLITCSATFQFDYFESA